MMLDTNAVSAMLKNEPGVRRLLTGGATAAHEPADRVTLSAITVGELMFGLSRREGKRNLTIRVNALLDTLETLPWTLEAAHAYGRIRADCERRGRSIGALDMLIAAHAVSLGARLVTKDRSFASLELPDLSLVSY